MPISILDGNAFAIMGQARRELINLGREAEVATLMAEMTSGDYNNLLQVLFKWFPDAEVAN
jgi:hypothetical protein